MAAVGDFEFQELLLGPFEYRSEDPYSPPSPSNPTVGQAQYTVTASAPTGKRIVAHSYSAVLSTDPGANGLETVLRPRLSNDGKDLVFNVTTQWGSWDAYLSVQLSSARLGTCED